MSMLLRASLVALTIVLAAHAAQANDTVHVGKAQGTAWTFLVAALRGTPPDLEAWARLAMPDLLQCEAPDHPDDMLAP